MSLFVNFAGYTKFCVPTAKKKQNKTKQKKKQNKGKKKLHKRAMKIFQLLVVRIKKHIS